MTEPSFQPDLRPTSDQDRILISFIVPVFNTEKYLRETLDSIAAYGGRDVELIVVNDGSTDGSAQSLSAWIDMNDISVQVINQKNSGLSAARMAGLALARGIFVGFCDSDDRIDITVYVKMARMAEDRCCDIAICRSIVFDSVTEDSYDFYDANMWNNIIGPSFYQILNVLSEPQLFRLEPNANTRLLRRSYMLRNGLIFPDGLHFEDFPVHVHGLSMANSVLLLNATGYFYRVNRYGKITDQKSAKRFDILKSVTLAFEYARHVDDRGLAQITASACRMIYWCGTNTLNKDRANFFSAACILLDHLVPSSLWPLVSSTALDERERLIIDAMAAHADGLLADISSKRRPRPKNAFLLLLNRRQGQTARRVALRIMKRRFGDFICRLPQLGRPLKR